MGIESKDARDEPLTTDRERLIAALWNLRDDAYDHPKRWSAESAETVFQVLDSTMEELVASDEPLNAVEFVWLVRAEVDKSQRPD